MAMLIYIAITSLDGYVEDEGGTFDGTVPDEVVHTFVNGLLRPVGTYLYGRRMYETMVGWETMDTAAQAPFTRNFAEIWRAADKIVCLPCTSISSMYASLLNAASVSINIRIRWCTHNRVNPFLLTPHVQVRRPFHQTQRFSAVFCSQRLVAVDLESVPIKHDRLRQVRIAQILGVLTEFQRSFSRVPLDLE
jgi:hypothetical protein